jgi:hypothetical protein
VLWLARPSPVSVRQLARGWAHWADSSEDSHKNMADFSILNDPKEFINPTGLANPDMLAAPTMTATAADSGGMDWNKIVQGIAMAGMAGISAGRGDTMAGMRMTQLMQENERRNQDQKLQQETHTLNKEKHELTIGELRKKDTARAAIRDIDMEEFGKDPSGAMLKMMPHLIDLNPDAATSVFAAAVKAKGDEKASQAAFKAGKLIEAATEEDGTINTRKVAAGLATISDPEVTKAIKAYEGLINEQGREKRATETNDRLIQNQKDSNEKFLISQDRLRDSMAQQAAQFQQGQANQTMRFNAAQEGMERRLNERLAIQKEQYEKATPSQIKDITAHQKVITVINDYEAAYNDLMKETKGQLSAMFKGSLAQHRRAKSIYDLFDSGGKPLPLTGGTEAEKNFAAKYTSIMGNLRSITDEVGVLTDIDAARNLGVFDPSVAPGQVKANLNAARQVRQRNLEVTLDTMEASGKNVSKLREATKPGPPPAPLPGAKTPAGATTAPAQTAPASAAPTRPRAVNKQTGEVMEWDGKAWVKVK